MEALLNSEVGNPAILVFVVLMVGALTTAGFFAFSKLRTLITNNQRLSEICFKILEKNQGKLGQNQDAISKTNIGFYEEVDNTLARVAAAKIKNYSRKLSSKWKRARAENRLG